MKKQVNQKKISLNKETVTRLTNQELKQIKGEAGPYVRPTQDGWKCCGT